MKLPKQICRMLVLILFCCALSTEGSIAATDVFWIDRYGNISWEDEKARLDNFAIQLSQDPNQIAYIIVNAGRRSCRGEAQYRAVRAKNYMLRVRGADSSRIIWRDIGFREEPEVQLYLFPRGSNVAYTAFERQAAQAGQVVENCRGIYRRGRCG